MGSIPGYSAGRSLEKFEPFGFTDDFQGFADQSPVFREPVLQKSTLHFSLPVGSCGIELFAGKRIFARVIWGTKNRMACPSGSDGCSRAQWPASANRPCLSASSALKAFAVWSKLVF